MDNNTNAESQEETLDKDEQSAFFLHMAHQDFKRIAYTVANRKKRSVARVLEAVLFEPLEKVELLGKEEKELFDLCRQIMYHKGVVFEYAINRNKEGDVNEQG